jgi:NAD(P)H-hydrate epimerase
MSLYDIMQIATPETMISPDSNSNIIASLPDLSKYSAVGVGPGIGTDKPTVDVLEQLIDTCKVPLVLDADALNILSLNKELIKKLPKETILTPHPKEFERLFGKTSDSMQRLDLLVDSAKKYNIIIVLKGAHTAVADVDGNIMFNSTGNPGMATAGSGDVLTGVITSLLAQRYDAITAAVLGVYAHGLSGDIVKEQKGYYGIIASDIIDNLPYAFNRISVRNQK